MLVAVIVTYNRKNLLSENIQMLKKQTREPDRIVIVDNCSTDGTYDHLKQNGWCDNDQFFYLKTEANIGGAGGFYTGVKAAYEMGADWVLLMDDDGKCADENTIEELMRVGEKMLSEGVSGGKLFINSLVQKEELLSFKIDHAYTVEEALKMANNGIIENAANPFNGTLVSRALIEAIGYPNKEFFIKGDEVNYKQRSYDAQASVLTVTASRYTHPRPETYEKVILGKKVPFFVEAPWKEYYACRNFTYMYKRNHWYKGIAFELLFVKTLAILTFKCPKWKTFSMMCKGFCDGWKGKLGATVKP